ncbi:hypothetical protein Tco_0875509 [Tanacetum coccineum]|uniref:Uncharacterized protein n=1 Tax=Tanacetum coccineum TaxID=301880 RepID=A0ABQ5BT60_9ASTR
MNGEVMVIQGCNSGGEGGGAWRRWWQIWWLSAVTIGCDGATVDMVVRVVRGDDGGGVMVGCGGEAAGGEGGAWRSVSVGIEWIGR